MKPHDFIWACVLMFLSGSVLTATALLFLFTRPAPPRPREDGDAANSHEHLPGLVGNPYEYDDAPPFGSKANDEK